MSRWHLSALLLLAGCSADDGEGGAASGPAYPYVESVPVAGCDVPTACDIVTAQCQNDWLATVTCLRGMQPMSVPVRVIDEQAFAAELTAEPYEPRPSPDHWENALSYLGFVAPGAYQSGALVEQRAENVAAYYSAESRAITVVDHGLPSDGIRQNSTLFHELVHAAQDQELGLETYGNDAVTSDSVMGVLALVEGEAEFYQTLVLGGLNGINVDELDAAAILAEKRAFLLDEALSDSSPYLMALYTMPYGLGAPYAERAYAARGAQGIRDLFAAPHPTTRQLLLLDVGGDRNLAPAEFLDVAVLTAADFEPQHTDAFGALGLMIHGGPEFLPTTTNLSAALRGDRFDVLSHGDDTAFVWQLSFDDSANATAFLNMAKVRPLGGAPRQWLDRGGGQLVLVSATVSSTVTLLRSALGL